MGSALLRNRRETGKADISTLRERGHFYLALSKIRWIVVGHTDRNVVILVRLTINRLAVTSILTHNTPLTGKLIFNSQAIVHTVSRPLTNHTQFSVRHKFIHREA